jgi:hypothetical protein
MRSFYVVTKWSKLFLWKVKKISIEGEIWILAHMRFLTNNMLTLKGSWQCLIFTQKVLDKIIFNTMQQRHVLNFTEF